MKNPSTCKNCGASNPSFQLICSNCNSFMRERIFNIDLWQIIGLILENPQEAFRRIVNAEHKNFIFLIISIVSGKLLIDTMFIALTISKEDIFFSGLLIKYLIIFAALLFLLLLFAALLKIINKYFQYETRIKDNFALLAYSLIPHVFGLVIIFVIEIIVFGGDLFSNNPSPFSLKEFLAYALLSFEILLIGWSIFISIASLFFQTRNKIYSFIVGVVFNSFLYGCLILGAKILFNY